MTYGNESIGLGIGVGLERGEEGGEVFQSGQERRIVMDLNYLFEHRPTAAERGETIRVSEKRWREINSEAERKRTNDWIKSLGTLASYE